VRRGSWRCGRGSIAEAVAEAVNNFLSTRKGKNQNSNEIMIREMTLSIGSRKFKVFYVRVLSMVFRLMSYTYLEPQGQP